MKTDLGPFDQLKFQQETTTRQEQISMSIFSRKNQRRRRARVRRRHLRRRGHLRRLHHRRHPHPPRLLRPARDGDHRPRRVHLLRGQRHRRHREPGQLQGRARHRRTQHRDRRRRPRRPPEVRPTSSTPRAYPKITFSSTSVERDGADWAITGDLTIKDVTKPVTILFEETGSAQDPFGNLRVGFEGGTTLNRKDWGLTWNAALETGGVLVSEKVKLEFDVSAIRTA